MAHSAAIGIPQLLSALPCSGARSQSINTGSVSPRRCTKHPVGRLCAGVAPRLPSRQQNSNIGNPARGNAIGCKRFNAALTQGNRQHRQRLIKGRRQIRVVVNNRFCGARQRATRGKVQPFQLATVKVPEQPGRGKDHITPHRVIGARPGRQPLQAVNNAPAVPDRPNTHKFQTKSDHHAFVAHCIRSPKNQRITFITLSGTGFFRFCDQFLSQRPGNSCRNQVVRQGMKISPGGQNLGGS